MIVAQITDSHVVAQGHRYYDIVDTNALLARAIAHLNALDYLRAGGESTTLNCGYGHGYSVREVLRAVEKAHGAKLPIEDAPRRAGDPPALIAGCDRIKAELGWEPRYDNLDQIVTSSLNWEKHLLENPAE